MNRMYPFIVEKGEYLQTVKSFFDKFDGNSNCRIIFIDVTDVQHSKEIPLFRGELVEGDLKGFENYHIFLINIKDNVLRLYIESN